MVSIIPTDNYEYKPILALTLELITNDYTEINLEHLATTFREAFSGLIVTERFQLVLLYKEQTLVCRISDFKFDKSLARFMGS